MMRLYWARYVFLLFLIVVTGLLVYVSNAEDR